jgi:hypothetical protein
MIKIVFEVLGTTDFLRSSAERNHRRALDRDKPRPDSPAAGLAQII